MKTTRPKTIARTAVVEPTAICNATVMCAQILADIAIDYVGRNIGKVTPKLSTFIIRNSIYRMKASQKYFIYCWKQNHWICLLVALGMWQIWKQNQKPGSRGYSHFRERTTTVDTVTSKAETFVNTWDTQISLGNMRRHNQWRFSSRMICSSPQKLLISVLKV